MRYTIEIGLVAFTCDRCGATFGLPLSFYQHWETFSAQDATVRIHCACCGHKWYRGDGPLQRLEKQLASERAAHDQTRAARDAARAQREAANRRAAAARGQVTKIRNRVGNGVCPACSRTFQNLARHMACKHPEFKHAHDE